MAPWEKSYGAMRWGWRNGYAHVAGHLPQVMAQMRRNLIWYEVYVLRQGYLIFTLRMH